MINTPKNWQKRANVTIDQSQVDFLKKRANECGITYTHLLRIIVHAYVQDKINIDKYLPDWIKY